MLIGLALLPFVIPILWLVGPVIIGEPPVLSIATAVALALSASVLCLAVIYTIDWTPSTRIKGVLMLVALAYFAAVSLYFMKREIVEHVKKITGWEDGTGWTVFHANPGGYQIRMPGPRTPVKDQQDQPCPSVAKLALWRATHKMPLLEDYVFVVGASPANRLVKARDNGHDAGTSEWYDHVIDEIVKRCGGRLTQSRDVEQQGYKGREAEIGFGEGKPVRFVRVFLIQGRVFYLAAEGLGLSSDEEPASVFFQSFLVNGIRN